MDNFFAISRVPFPSPPFKIPGFAMIMLDGEPHHVISVEAPWLPFYRHGVSVHLLIKDVGLWDSVNLILFQVISCMNRPKTHLKQFTYYFSTNKSI
jgi:hypothetical protein